jgi:hypothetical protein
VQPGDVGAQLADLGDQGLGLSHSTSISALTPMSTTPGGRTHGATPESGARRSTGSHCGAAPVQRAAVFSPLIVQLAATASRAAPRAVEVAASHSVYVSQPAAVTACIKQAASAVAARQ